MVFQFSFFLAALIQVLGYGVTEKEEDFKIRHTSSADNSGNICI